MKAKISLGVLGIALVGAVGTLSVPFHAAPHAATRVGQIAPEITGSPWINSEPLSMQKLRGRVVYVEFWTFT